MTNYQKQKERVRYKAMRFQETLDEFNLSWNELYSWQVYFYKLARRYGLLEEFTENGIL